VTEIAAGTIVDGRYKVVSRLGAGGMADVFLAEDQQLGRKVALKLLHRRFAEDPGFVERFRREAQAAAGLQHPNVVSVYDRGAFDDTYYIAMEYLPGRTLKQLIREDAPIDPVRAIDITIQILKAARFAHRRGIIHRDLKPHNVIIDDSDHAKVTDFGIARAGASDMTETGSIMGTAQYLSPEQAQGHAVSASSDLYSVAVVLYELLTGRVPFDADAAVTIALKHVSEAPTPVRALNPNVPEELEQVVMWALNKSPTDRPANADEFVAALEHAKSLITEGVRGQQTASIAAVGALVGPTGGTPGPTPTASSVAPGVPPDAPPGWVGDGDGQPSDLEDEQEPEGRRRWWVWGAVVLVLLLAGGGAAAYFLTRPKQVEVPTVVGENVNIARTQVLNAGLTPNVVYQADKHRSGYVFGQDPLGQAKADKGSTVTLTVSSGPGNATVPSVQGLKVTQAEAEIRHAHLKPGRVIQQSSTIYATGLVIDTSPAAGQTPPVGTTVNLTVSTGKPLIAIPNVAGDSVSAAKSQLSSAGFSSVTTSQQTSSTVKPGNVISSTPSAGTKVTGDTPITLAVAQAPTTATVPGVKGDTVAAATSALKAAGFQVVETMKAVKNQAKNGLVLSQSPAGNSTAKKKSTVTIVVGQYTAPPPTTTTTTTPTTPTTTTTTTPKP
jgi:serine/threonine-protein kinase